MRGRVHLADGRRIEYREFGDAAGLPAIYLHGTPSSASEGRWLDAPSRAAGIRLVALDRPGYLGSDAHVPASPLGVADDVVAVADALALDRFAVVGFSGGAGYAFATGYAAPGRITVVHVGGGLVSLAGPAGDAMPRLRRLAFVVMARAPLVSRPLLGGGFRLFRRAIEKRLGSPVEAAKWFFDGPARGAQVEAVARYIHSTPPDDLRQDLSDHARATERTQAILDDIVSYASPCPFELGQVDVPVELWHGDDDPAVPVAFAERAAAELPRAVLHVFPGEGHFVFHSHGAEIAASIARHGALARPEVVRC